MSSTGRIPLKILAHKRGMEIGTAVLNRCLGNKEYEHALLKHFNIAAPEYEFMFIFTHPGRDRYDFKLADKVVSFAYKNKMRIRGGPQIIWGHKLGAPEWFAKGKFTKKESTEIMRDYINTVVNRYKDKIKEWTAVNEAMDEQGRLKKCSWLEKVGPKYIELAFRFMHEADPNAVLYYNDFNIDEINKKSDAVYRLVKRLLKKRVPIRGVGLQMHLLEEMGISSESVAKNIKRFKKLGLEVNITEMDVRIKKPVTKRKLLHQAKIYREIVELAIKMKCGQFSMWGFTDRYSWIPGWTKGYGSALILDRRYAPKPAYYEIERAFLSR